MTDAAARESRGVGVRRRAHRRLVPASLLVVLATALWGTTGTGQALGPVASSPVQVACLRCALGAVALLLVTAATGGGGSLRRLLAPDVRAWVLLATVGIGGFQALFFVAMDLAGVAIGTLVTIGSAPIVAGLGEAVSGARPGRAWRIGTLVSIIGTALILLPGRADPTIESVGVLGIVVAVVAGGGYAIYALASARVLARGGSSLALISIAFTGSGIALSPALVGGDLTWVPTWPGLAMIGWLGLIVVGVGYPVFNAGLRHVGAASATSLGLTEPLVAAVLAVVLLGERLEPVGVAGALLVGVGLVIVSRPPRAPTAHA